MLYKRPDSKYWHVKLKHRGGVLRKSTRCTRKKDAERVQEQWRRHLEAQRKRSAHTFGDAAIRWLDEKKQKRSLESDLSIISWFQPRIENLLLSEITRDVIEQLREAKRAEGVKDSSVNRYMALLRSILKRAKDDWEWIDTIPKVPMYATTSAGPRFLSWSQWLSLAIELPPHLQGPAWFAVSTGLRAAAIRSLRWGWISRDGVRFPPEVMKSGKWLSIPLSQDAWYTLALEWQRAGIGSKLADSCVFVNHTGSPWAGKFSTRAWQKACDRAGLAGTRFHDLRHTWASWHAQKGTPMNVVQKLGGWSTYEAMQIYAHFDTKSLEKWV